MKLGRHRNKIYLHEHIAVARDRRHHFLGILNKSIECSEKNKTLTGSRFMLLMQARANKKKRSLLVGLLRSLGNLKLGEGLKVIPVKGRKNSHIHTQMSIVHWLIS